MMKLSGLAVAVAALAITACSSSADAADKALLDAHASYPEGPLFAGNTLYVAEMGADRVSAYEGGKKRTFFKSEGCGPTALAPYRDGYLILCHIGGELVLVDKSGKEEQRFGKGLLRDPNDGYADPMGGVYFSDPGIFSKDVKAEGLVYRLTPDGNLDRVEAGLWYPNGVYVDKAEKTVYVSETFARKVWRYAMGADGALSGKTLFADVDAIAPKSKFFYREAGPDGLERDPATGEMIVSIYGEGRLLRITRDGKFAGQINTPSQYETNIAFGAPGAVVVGAYDNANPPLPGEVRWWKRAP
jgi:sugar lactone lactonase YvrE